MTAVTALRSEREELLEALLARGILRRTELQPVLSRDGASARWMLESLPVTLTARGAELAGRLVLERLARFDGRQLATFGLMAAPILQAAILQSNALPAGSRCHGLLVRKERKAHGSRKLIEGPIDLDQPVILIDDSIASGMSASEGIAILEAAGLRVEGCIALVRFGWEGGCSALSERGYHVEAVYDIFEDFMARMDGEKGPDYNPTKNFPDFRWSARRACEGLHPADLARQALLEYFRSGELLRPPARLDGAAYDSSGGAWVSLRSREDLFERHARDGFWHFPGERSWGAPEDVLRAALRTAGELPAGAEGLKLVESSHIAVTFFGALERATVGELDNGRYGIVVVSGERPEIMGGALPRMPGIRDEWQQFRHARYNNAALEAHEPYVIYRHDVAKFAEPGAPWPSSGVPGAGHAFDCGALAARAREMILGGATARPLPEIALPPAAKMLFVTIYIDGEVRGCMGSEIGDLDEDLRELTAAALADERFERAAIDADSDVAASVSVLSNELEMGDFSREEVRFRYCHGQQALMLDQNGREGMLLPCVAAWLCLDAADFVDEVIDKAGVTRPPYNWRRFDCHTWLADREGVSPLDGAFKRSGGARLGLREIARLHADYLLRNQLPDGSLYFSYYPFQNTLHQGIDTIRLAHGAWTLARAGLLDAARLALARALRDAPEDWTALARDAFVLLTLCEPGMPALADACGVAERLWDAIDRHGRVTTWIPPAAAAGAEDESEAEDADDAEDCAGTPDPEELQNYAPGQALLALAAAARTGRCAARRDKLARAFLYYRHRFRYKRDFGQVSWMALAWSAWQREEARPEFAAFVFEIADWILDFQSAATGAFLTDQQTDAPGYTTAVYLEAVAAAAHTASSIGDEARSIRYAEAFERGFNFLDRLIVQERDSSVLPNCEYAAGGLRENLHSAHIRIDFVQHSLAAILELHPEALVPHQSGESEWQKNRKSPDPS